MRRRLSRTLLAGLVAALPCAASAQSLSFAGGGTSTTVRAADDFATVSIGDAWDMVESSDHVFMFSTGWLSGPSVSNGRLSGTAGQSPAIQLQFEGLNGALNLIGRNGVTYPIDPALFNRISYKLSWSATPPAGDVVGVTWLQNTLRTTESLGGRIGLSYGYDGAVGRYINQSPVSSQSAAGYHIMKRDLDTTDPNPARSWGATWAQAGVVRGLILGLGGTGVSGMTIAVDWVRLSRRGVATVGLAWSGFGGAITLTATNSATGDTIQIFPDSGSSTSTFSDNSSFTWDYGFLPAGTWTITAARGSTSRQATLVVKETPTVTVVEPDSAGGEDFATATAGDSWDLTASTDVSRWGWLSNITGETYSTTGLHAASLTSDPSVYLLGDPYRPLVQTIDAANYRHLTFTIEYDRKSYRWDSSLGFQRDLGGVARVIWQQANGTTGLTNTQDIIVMDGGPHTYSADLATFTKFGGNDCVDCTLEVGHGTNLWTGRISVFRIDPLEPTVQQGFRIANVRVAADDSPNAQGFFLVKWEANDPASTVKVYYDTDTNGANGRTMIASGLSAASGQYNWDLVGVPVGRYWIYVEVTDSLGNSKGRYSTGPVRVSTVVADADRDGMNDTWELQMGLHPHVGSADGPNGDADGDGRSNLQEYLDGTHPRGTYARYFAEGASGSFFDCRFALVNPSTTATVNVLLRFLKRDLTTTSQYVQVPPRERRTVSSKEVPGIATAEFSTVVEADGVVVADRTMSWDATGYGSHAETSLAGPSTVWYLAEGATHWNFDLYYTIQNPSLTTDAALEVTYLRPAPLAPVVKPYVVPANSRYNIWVDGEGVELAATDVSAQLVVTNGVPVIVERSMYLTTPGQFWGAGHNAAGVTAPALDWFLAEGATGSYFNMYVLLANPNPTAAVVDVTYMPEGAAAFTKRYTVAGHSRFNIAVNGEDARVANASLSTAVHVVNGVPIIVERSMWWPGPGAATWAEAHASAGLTATGTAWALADGENAGTGNVQTYVLVANTSAYAGTVEVTLVFEDGTPAVTKSFGVAANSRRTIYPPVDFAGQVPAGTAKRFGTIVESVGSTPAQVVVERAMYRDATGVGWASGTNAVATRLR